MEVTLNTPKTINYLAERGINQSCTSYTQATEGAAVGFCN